MTNKEIINKIKQEIKQKEENQRFLKGQRKTVKLVGERKVDPFSAWAEVRNNKYHLTAVYIAYYILKHKMVAPVIKEELTKWGGVSKNLINPEEFKQAVIGCCGANSYWDLDKDPDNSYYEPLENISVKVDDQIKEWTKNYCNNEKAE